MQTSLLSAGRMNAKAPSVNTITMSAEELALLNKIEEILRYDLEKTLVLCPGGTYKSGQDAGMPVIAGLFCLELRTMLAGKPEKDRLELLQEQFENFSSAVEEARVISEKERGRATRGKSNGRPAVKITTRKFSAQPPEIVFLQKVLDGDGDWPIGWWTQYEHEPKLAVGAKVEQAFEEPDGRLWYTGVVMSQTEDGNTSIEYDADGDKQIYSPEEIAKEMSQGDLRITSSPKYETVLKEKGTGKPPRMTAPWPGPGPWAMWLDSHLKEMILSNFRSRRDPARVDNRLPDAEDHLSEAGTPAQRLPKRACHQHQPDA